MGCDIHMVVEVRGPGGEWHVAPVDLAYDGRNYKLFSVLADVRNETWSEPIAPIAPPRGLPADLSASARECEDKYGRILEGADHSESWVTLRELVEYPWGRELTMRATVGYDQWVRMQMDGLNPGSYCASASNEVSEDEAKRIRERGGPTDIWRVSVRTSWTMTMREAVGHVTFEWLDRLRALPHSLDDVRLVFGFDN